MSSITQRLALAFALSTTALASSTLNAAKGDQYFGVQYSSVTFEAFDLEWEPSALIGKYGNYLSDNFAIEGRLGIGTSSDTISAFDPFVGNISLEVEIDTLIGIYGVGSHDFSNNLSVYALIGATSGELTFTAAGGLGNGSDSESETDLSYGVGANIYINDAVGINLEYISYISKTDFDVTAVNFGVVARF